jgi:hypothetical protein
MNRNKDHAKSAWKAVVRFVTIVSIATATVAGPVAAANAKPAGPGPDNRVCHFRGNEYYDGTSVVMYGKVYECLAHSGGGAWIFQYDTGRR